MERGEVGKGKRGEGRGEGRVGKRGGKGRKGRREEEGEKGEEKSGKRNGGAGEVHTKTNVLVDSVY